MLAARRDAARASSAFVVRAKKQSRERFTTRRGKKKTRARTVRFFSAASSRRRVVSALATCRPHRDELSSRRVRRRFGSGDVDAARTRLSRLDVSSDPRLSRSSVASSSPPPPRPRGGMRIGALAARIVEAASRERERNEEGAKATACARYRARLELSWSSSHPTHQGRSIPHKNSSSVS